MASTSCTLQLSWALTVIPQESQGLRSLRGQPAAQEHPRLLYLEVRGGIEGPGSPPSTPARCGCGNTPPPGSAPAADFPPQRGFFSSRLLHTGAPLLLYFSSIAQAPAISRLADGAAGIIMGRNVILPVLEVFVCKRAQAASCSPYFPCRGPTASAPSAPPPREFVDFLAAGGQKFWQILPLVPPPAGATPPTCPPPPSPATPSSWIWMSWRRRACSPRRSWTPPRRDKPDGWTIPGSWRPGFPLLRKAWARGRARYARELAEFLEAERSWLPDYALFLALRDRFDGKPLADWPDELRLRKQSALEKARAELKEACDFHAFLQLLFFRQWTAVKAYANGERASPSSGICPSTSPPTAPRCGPGRSCSSSRRT